MNYELGNVDPHFSLLLLIQEIGISCALHLNTLLAC
uniref:Uncharacterized protein n=1 Tax=Arundo donax TaxID=35708 RepID=A0A0A9BWH0_ARUDO